MTDKTIETCCVCDEPTGRAGRADDSLYCDECDVGPFCEECWDDHHKDYNHGEVAGLRRQLAKLQGIVDSLNRLRAEEGGSVTIYCSTEELHLQNEFVRVVGEWTRWEARDFEGETLAECLAKAEAAKKEQDDGW